MTEKILIVDDDMDNLIIASAVLKSSGYGVIHASNGIEALAIMSEEKPDLVLLDLSMPKMDGWHAAQKMKQDKELQNIPVIALSAHAMPGDELRARSAGCNDYLAKPCPPKMILDKVQEWLAKKQQGKN